jgi:hypothetical protein
MWNLMKKNYVEYRKLQMHPNIKDISGKPLESQGNYNVQNEGIQVTYY